MELAPTPQNTTAMTKDDEDVMYVSWQQQLHSFLFPTDIHNNLLHSYHSILHTVTKQDKYGENILVIPCSYCGVF